MQLTHMQKINNLKGELKGKKRGGGGRKKQNKYGKKMVPSLESFSLPDLNLLNP